MKNFQRQSIHKRIYPLLTLVAVASLFCVLTPLSRATAPSITVNVVNNAQKGISHLYLASAGSDNWTADQLTGAINAGASQNVSITWSESTAQLIAEDEDGCFLTTTIENSGSPSWTITNSTARDCGY
jgi:hypothetical protein